VRALALLTSKTGGETRPAHGEKASQARTCLNLMQDESLSLPEAQNGSAMEIAEEIDIIIRHDERRRNPSNCGHRMHTSDGFGPFRLDVRNRRRRMSNSRQGAKNVSMIMAPFVARRRRHRQGNGDCGSNKQTADNAEDQPYRP
jgi:hypothetical protein